MVDTEVAKALKTSNRQIALALKQANIENARVLAQSNAEIARVLAQRSERMEEKLDAIMGNHLPHLEKLMALLSLKVNIIIGGLGLGIPLLTALAYYVITK